MNFLQRKIKPGIMTLLAYLLILAEMGLLSGYMFCTPNDTYPLGLTVSKVTAAASSIGEHVGWQYVVCSFLIIVVLIAYSFLLGYSKNVGGIIAVVFVSLIPVWGAFVSYDFLYAWGTAHLIPAMSMFGLHVSSLGAQLVFVIVTIVLQIAAWIGGRQVIINKQKNDPLYA